MSGQKELRAAIQGVHGTDEGPDVILLSAEIDRSLYMRLSEELGSVKRGKERCTVFLSTHGGDAHAAFRIARCLRFHYKHVRLVVPHYCKSAGTLIAVGADTVAIGDTGELGPLDVQIANRKELFERSSGLDFTEALIAMQQHARMAFRGALIDIRGGGQVSTKMAGEFATQLAVGAVSAMYAQIDPIQVGEVYRAMKIAYEYAERLNRQSKQLKDGALTSLVNGYPDHGFVIDRKEAESIFNRVEKLLEEEREFARVFSLFLKEETDQCIVFPKPTPKEVNDGSVPGAPDAVPADPPGGGGSVDTGPADAQAANDAGDGDHAVGGSGS